MISTGAVRQGLRTFIAGRAASGVLGVVWLVLIARVLDLKELGLYFGVLALFEVCQLLSSLGVYGYSQRLLPASWVADPAASFNRLLARIWAWRMGSLCAIAALLVLAWGPVVTWLGWPSDAFSPWLIVAFVVLEGGARFADALFECTLKQVFCQALSVGRHLARLCVVVWLALSGHRPQAADLLLLECLLAGVALGAGGWLLWRMGRSLVPLQRSGGAAPPDGLMRFAFQGYFALAIGQLCSADAIRLILTSVAGPAALGAYGLAAAAADIVRRYMPAFLLQGFVRSVLTAKAQLGASGDKALSTVVMLLRINAAFLAVITGAVAVLGEPLVLLLSRKPELDSFTQLVVLLLLALFIQAFRLVASIVAHLKTDNQATLIATLAALLTPIVVWWSVPVLGALGAVLGVWVLELSYTGVLMHRLGLRVVDLAGTPGFWGRLVAAVAAAGVLAHLWSLLGSGLAWQLGALVIYLGALAAVAAHLGLFKAAEFGVVRSMLGSKARRA